MSFRKYYIDVAEGKNKGIGARIFKVLLFLPMLLYWAAVSLRNFLYDKGAILKSQTFDIGVVSVGNLTWGGTAKTSLVISLARRFASKKITVLSRGYGSDEIALLKRSLDAGTEVFAAKDRAKILKDISCRYDIALVDDGFQYRRIKPQVNILLVNGFRPFGNGFLIPLGSLREPKTSIKRADIAIIMHKPNEELKEELQKIHPELLVFYGRYKPEALRRLLDDVSCKDELLHKPLACFCAIGYPEGFLDTLGQIGIIPKLKFIYPDHCNLDQRQLRSIEEECASLGIVDMIITAKDIDRFRPATKLSLYVLEISLEIDSEDEFFKAVNNKLSKVKV